ncbi:MAG: MFS transporter, partial [Erysipelotrichaceae bacterium]|nr:MFS transporter [Erysipelotrichaceae bacterium]
MEKETNQISTIDKISFGIGDLGNGLSMQIIGSYLVFFMTAILGVPGTMAGLIVGVSIFWDAVTDPLMGYISDHTRSDKYGRRHLYLMIGMLGVSISNIALFSLPVKMDMLFKVI